MPIARQIRCFLFVTLIPLLAQSQDSLRVASPNGRLTFQFSIREGGVPYYEIHYNQQPIILPSRLGLLNNPNGHPEAPTWNEKFMVLKTSMRRVDTSWKPLYGERDEIPDRYHELTLTLQDTAKVDGKEKGKMQL